MELEFDPNKNIGKLDFIHIVYSYLRTLLTTFLHGYNIVKNWYDVILFKFKLKKNIVVNFRNGEKFEINSFGDHQNSWNNISKAVLKEKIKSYGIKLNFEEEKISFEWNGNKLIFLETFDTLYLIFEQFVEDHLSRLDVKDKIVIDIGANIGDSAIYFALKGAKHIYAFEPYPYSYQFARKNIELNKLQNKITLLNEGIGKKEKYIKIPPDFESKGGEDLKEFKEGKEVKITTLEEVINRFNINSAVLKMDCEGCEYSSILNCDVLKHFNQIMIDYHYGYKNLVEKLKKEGFKVEYTLPKFSYNPSSTNPKMYVGWIYASL
ncbi:MAG: FkbM family methyltransferase [Thermoplasmatales archaeon]|nr:FkbM family methyltransferase [Thermoplasmatales archaeon]